MVYDSLLAGGPLASAEVWIDGTTLSARTDGAGRFRFDSVPAGRHRVTFVHPTLAAQRIGAPVATVDIPPGAEAALTLATPTPALVHRALCPAAAEPRTGALVGLLAPLGATAEGAPSGAPVRVTASWVVHSIAPRTGLTSTIRELSTQTGADGAFHLCGVPIDVPVEVRAEGADGGGSVLEVSFGERAVAFARLPITSPALSDASDTGAPATAGTVRGVVQAPDGSPAAGVEVRALVGDGDAVASAVTREDGRFELRAVAAGPVVVEARAIGFRPARLRVAAAAGRAVPVVLTLNADATVLATTRVTARRPTAMLEEFERRRSAGAGRFVTRDDLERWRPTTTLDAVAMVPGVRIVPGGQYGQGAQIAIPRALTGPLTNASCRAAVYVDGVRWATDLGQPLEAVVRTEDVYGIEVHSTLAAIPPQFQPPDAGCGVVLIWTRRGR